MASMFATLSWAAKTKNIGLDYVGKFYELKNKTFHEPVDWS
jgi:hypothetical protein